MFTSSKSITRPNFYALLLAILALWLVGFYTGFISAFRVWQVSEIYTHGFFVIPASAYLIYRKLQQTSSTVELKPNYWLLLPLLLLIAMQVFAYVGSIETLMQIASFTALPIMLWAVLGNQFAKKNAFPLFFILFSIPVGDQIIPQLQHLTTNLAVPLLELSGVPIFRSGLYLEIPEGRFLVAEACSGISFLVASTVFGFLYAYLSFESLKKRALFIAVSIVVPILANAVRVYGIVLTGHLSDMQYAVGADHLIYGAVFYAIILFILLSIGERFRDKSPQIATKSTEVSAQMQLAKQAVATSFSLILLLLLSQQIWVKVISAQSNEKVTVEQISYGDFEPLSVQEIKWQPQFNNADLIFHGKNKSNLELYIAVYAQNFINSPEMINSQHKLFDSDNWSLDFQRNIVIHNTKFTLLALASPYGKNRLVAYQYRVGSLHTNNAVIAKLTRAFYRMIGKNKMQSSFIAYSLEPNSKAIKEQVLYFQSILEKQQLKSW